MWEQQLKNIFDLSNAGITVLVMILSFGIMRVYAEEVKYLFFTKRFFLYLIGALGVNALIAWMAFTYPPNVVGHLMLFIVIYIVALFPSYYLAEVALAEACLFFMLFHIMGWNSYFYMAVVQAYHICIAKGVSPKFKIWRL